MKKKLYRLFAAMFVSLAVWNFSLAAPIEIATPLVPGGAVDLTARAISKALTEAGHENVVTYHPGANGDIALNHIQQKKDNVVLIASSATFVFSNVVAGRDNNWAKQNVLVGPTLTNPMVFLTRDPAMSMSDLIARARRETVPCGVSNAHGDIELRNINQRYRTKFEPITYKGTGQLIPDIIGGHIPCAYDQIAPYAGLRDKLNFLAASRAWQTVPSLDKTLPGYQYETWYAAAVPNGSNLLQNQEVMKILTNWAQQKEIVQPLLDRSFMLAQPDANLNQRAQRESDFYLQLIKK